MRGSNTVFTRESEEQGDLDLDISLGNYWDFFGNPQRQFQEEQKQIGPKERRKVIRNRLRGGTATPVNEEMSRWSLYGRGSHDHDSEVALEEGVDARPVRRTKVIKNNLRGGNTVMPKREESLWSTHDGKRPSTLLPAVHFLEQAFAGADFSTEKFSAALCLISAALFQCP